MRTEEMKRLGRLARMPETEYEKELFSTALASNKKRIILENVVYGLEEFIAMVVDNTKMPHQHSDPQLRLYCLAELAQKVLDEHS